MYCKNCGNKLDNNFKFCSNCGNKLEDKINSSVETNEVKNWQSQEYSNINILNNGVNLIQKEKHKLNSYFQMNIKPNESILIGLITTIIGIAITIGTFFFFGPFFGCPILITGSILFFNGILYNFERKIKLMISILMSIIICAIVIIISVNIWTPNYVSEEDTLKYLNDTYLLTDLTLVEEHDNYPLSSSTYTYYFTNNELNGKTFFVETEFDTNGEMVFKDNYISTKYEDRLEKQYSVYFNKIIKQNFDISVSVDDAYNIPLITYEEYLELSNNYEIDITLKSKMKLDDNNKYFHLKTTDKSNTSEVLKIAESEIKKFINSNFNIEQLKADVKSIITLNNLNNVDSVNFYLYDCNENEYHISCSKLIELHKKYKG